MPLPGLVNLGVAVGGLYATLGGDDEDAARGRQLVSYVVRHSFTQFEVFTMPANPKVLGQEYIKVSTYCKEGWPIL